MKRRITRLREGNHLANGRNPPRAIVETVYEDQMHEPGATRPVSCQPNVA